MRRFWAIFKKEFRQVRRDRLTLGLLIFLPALLLVLYGYALSFDVKHIAMAVLDRDGTAESRRFLEGLFQNPYFDRRMTLAREGEVEGWLSRGRVRAVLILPRGFARDQARGGRVGVQVLVDGADATTATAVVGYVEALAERYTHGVRVADLGRGVGMGPGVVPETRVWFNPELESSYFLVPGLTGMLLMLSAVIATSLSIVREKERETMEQIMVSPVRPWELIVGKTLPYILICLVTMGMILGLSRGLFGLEVRGSYGLLGLTTVLFLFAALGMGMLISAVTRSQQVAFQMATLSTLLPSIVLSGFMFRIESMPWLIQGLTLLVVPRYFVSALRGIILKGAGLGVIWPELGALLVLGVGFNVLAMLRTRKKA